LSTDKSAVMAGFAAGAQAPLLSKKCIGESPLAFGLYLEQLLVVYMECVLHLLGSSLPDEIKNRLFLDTHNRGKGIKNGVECFIITE